MFSVLHIGAQHTEFHYIFAHTPTKLLLTNANYLKYASLCFSPLLPE